MAILGGKSKQMENVNVAEMEKKDIEALYQQNKEILEAIGELKNSVNTIDKNNKKFLMTASMQRTELLENEIFEMKMGIIGLLDQIDIIVSVVDSSLVEDIKSGLPAFKSKVSQLAKSMNIEEIPVVIGGEFNPDVQECNEMISSPHYGDNIVVKICQRGYIDKSTNRVLRCANVMVNKSERI